MQNTSFELQESGQNQSLHHEEIQYSAEADSLKSVPRATRVSLVIERIRLYD